MLWMIKILSFRAAVGQAKLVRWLFSTLIKTNVALSPRPLRLAVKYRVQQWERDGGNREKTLWRSLRGSGTNTSWNISVRARIDYDFMRPGWANLCSIAFVPAETTSTLEKRYQPRLTTESEFSTVPAASEPSAISSHLQPKAGEEKGACEVLSVLTPRGKRKHMPAACVSRADRSLKLLPQLPQI